MGSDTKEEGGKVEVKSTPSRAPGARPQRGQVQTGIADADKKARTGFEQEPVRNTPPAGDWNDVS
jgi:hypothetical protein